MEHGLRKTILVQALSNAGTSSAGLFIPLLAKQLGASEVELGLIGAAFGGALFISAWTFGRLADMGRRVLIIRIGLAACALSAPLQILASSPASLALARGLFGFAAGIFPAALIAHAYDAQRRPGRFAGWGALGWGIGTLGAGLLGSHQEVFLLSTATMAASFLVALRLEPRPEARVHVPWLPREVIRTNFPAYLAMLVRHIGAAAVWIIFPLYLQSLGASPLWIGLIYFLNTGCQFFFMGFMDRFPAGKLVIAGLATSSVVFLLFWLAPVWWLIIPVQLLLALSWALLYVGTLAWVMSRNVERATSTGLLQSTTSLANVIGPIVGGIVAQAWGYGATMVLASLLSLAGIPLFVSSAVRVERSQRERGAAEVVLMPAEVGTPRASPERNRRGLD